LNKPERSVEGLKVIGTDCILFGRLTKGNEVEVALGLGYGPYTSNDGAIKSHG